MKRVQTLRGSFSAVSKLIFAIKHFLEWWIFTKKEMGKGEDMIFPIYTKMRNINHIRWKALAEMYRMHSVLQLSNIKITTNSNFVKFGNILLNWQTCNYHNLLEFLERRRLLNSPRILTNFAGIFGSQKSRKLEFCRKFNSANFAGIPSNWPKPDVSRRFRPSNSRP